MIRVVDAKKLPRQQRSDKGDGIFTQTDIWLPVCRRILAGNLPEGKAFEVIFDLKDTGYTNQRSLVNFVKRFMRAQGVPYQASLRRIDNRFRLFIINPENEKGAKRKA